MLGYFLSLLQTLNTRPGGFQEFSLVSLAQSPTLLGGGGVQQVERDSSHPGRNELPDTGRGYQPAAGVLSCVCQKETENSASESSS